MDGYPPVGSIVGGRYRIDSVLGEGGMGAVFAATDANGNRFALKFPSPEMRGRPGMMGRFANEAVATSRIASDHVVRVHGVEATEQGVPFMVMELLDGIDLDQIIEREAPVAIPRAVHFALQILRALQVAHAHGVVHRDLKPSNCFVIRTAEGSEHVKLIDFGITKLLDEGASNKTATSVTMGTPAYMSPEQAKSAKAAEPRSDLYSVGVILYELLTKKRPYDGDSNNEIVVKICTEPPLPIREARPDLPPGLAGIVERALVKAAAGRYASAAAFADALKPWADLRSAGVLTQIETGVAMPSPDVVIGTGRGQTAEMQVGPTDPGTADPSRPVQRTVVADGPLMFQEAPPAYGGPGGTALGSPAPVPPMMPPMSPVIPQSGAPAVIPAASGGYERRGGGGGKGPLLALLGVAAAGLIGTGIYFAVAGSGSSSATPPAASPAKKAPADDQGDDDDDESTKKKKKKNTESGDPAAPEPEPTTPVPNGGAVAPKPTATVKTDAGVASPDAATPAPDAASPPVVDAAPAPTTPPSASGTTTAPTLVWPPKWGFPPSSSGTAPTTTTPPPATTTPPPATTTPPPATTTAPGTMPPMGSVIPKVKKPKIGGS